MEQRPRDEIIIKDVEDITHGVSSVDTIVFATNRGFGHWARMKNWIIGSHIKDNILMIAPEGCGRMTYDEIRSVLFDDPGTRFEYDQGILNKTTKFVSGNSIPTRDFYTLVPRVIDEIEARGGNIRRIILDCHNEPEKMYPEEIGIAEKGLNGAKKIFTLESQIFDELPERYRLAFSKTDHILVPYPQTVYESCVPKGNFGEYSDKITYAGFILGNKEKTLLRTDKIRARKALNRMMDTEIPLDGQMVLCTYGKGEGADDVMSALKQIMLENENITYVTSDPENRFRRMLGSPDNLKTISTAYEVMLLATAASDYTIQGLGTNTFQETVYSGTPAVCISLRRPFKEQESKGRAVKNMNLGFHIPISEISPEALRGGLDYISRTKDKIIRNQIALRPYYNGAEKTQRMVGR